MRKVQITTRIKPGRIISVPPMVRKGLQIAVGDKVNFYMAADGRVEVAKVSTPAEQRIKRLRDRLSGLASRHTDMHYRDPTFRLRNIGLM